MAKVIGM